MLQILAFHYETIFFLVTVTTNQLVILGFPQMDPEISWEDREIVKWSKSFVLDHLCVPKLIVASTSVESPGVTVTTNISGVCQGVQQDNSQWAPDTQTL